MPPRSVTSRVNRYCRLCLKEDTWGMALPICRDGIRSTIKEVLGVEVGISERLPNSICHSCLSKLEFFYNFKKEVRKSLNWLRDFGLDSCSTADTSQPVVEDAPRRTIGPKSRVTVQIEPINRVAIGPKNRVTKSCPSCEFKTGNPVDYRKHREDHQKESVKESAKNDNDSVPSEREENEGNDENVEKDTTDTQSLSCSTYFPCLECNMYLISSREKLLEHKIEKHGLIVGKSRRGEDENGKEEGGKSKEKDGSGGEEDGDNKEGRDSQEDGKNGNDSEEDGRTSKINDENGRNSKIVKDSEDNARNSKNGNDSGGDGEKSKEKDENIRTEVKCVNENDETSREIGKKRSRDMLVISSDSDDDLYLMPQLRPKKRLLTKRSSPKTLDRSKLRDADDMDSSSSESSSFNVSRSRKRAKPPPLDSSSSDEVPGESDSDSNENVPNQQKSEEDSKVGANQDQYPGEGQNRGSDDEIMLLIDDHMKTLINDCKNIDQKCIENGTNDGKPLQDDGGENKPLVDKTLPDREGNARKKVTNKKQELCDLCDKYFPSMSILASHKRRSHSNNTSMGKKVEGSSSGIDKPEDGENSNNSSRDSGGVKRLQDGGRIVKRLKNADNKRSQYGSVNKPSTDDRSVNKSQDGDSSATLSSCTVKTPQNDNKTVNRPQNDDRSVKRPRKGSSDSNGKKPPDTSSTVRRPQDNFKPQNEGSSNSKRPQDGESTVKRQQDVSSSVRKSLDGSTSSYTQKDGGSNMKKEIDLKLPCCICDKRFATASALENHGRDAHKSKTIAIQNRVACNLCSEKFPTVGTLLSHKYDAHKNVSTNR